MTTQRQEAMRRYGDFLRRHPVFTLSDLSRVADGREPRATAAERVKYYVATGKVRRVARELYAVVPAGADPLRHSPDVFLVVVALRSDAVFSHHSAHELLGAAHSDWNVCTAYSAGTRANLRVGSSTIRVTAPPKPLRNGDWNRLGVREVHRLGHLLRVTGPERTLVEGFRQPHLVGGLVEHVESAAGYPSLDLTLLERVLDAFAQRSLWAAVGWFLERYARTFHTTAAMLARFESNRPRSPQYMPRRLRGGTFLPRWNLVLPTEVVRGGERDDAGP